jgi:hypothetical protein
MLILQELAFAPHARGVGGVYDWGMIRTNVHLTKEQRAALKRISEQTGLSVAKVIRWAIDGFLERWEAEPYVEGWPHIMNGFIAESPGRAPRKEDYPP